MTKEQVPVTLLPCPFCGGVAETDRYGPEDAEPEMAINCRGECNGIFVFPAIAASDYEGLRHVWNTRIASSQSTPVASQSGDALREAINGWFVTDEPDIRGRFQIRYDHWDVIGYSVSGSDPRSLPGTAKVRRKKIWGWHADAAVRAARRVSHPLERPAWDLAA